MFLVVVNRLLLYINFVSTHSIIKRKIQHNIPSIFLRFGSINANHTPSSFFIGAPLRSINPFPLIAGMLMYMLLLYANVSCSFPRFTNFVMILLHENGKISFFFAAVQTFLIGNHSPVCDFNKKPEWHVYR